MTLFFIKTIYKLFIWLNVLCCLVKQRLIIIMNYNESVFHEMFKLNNRMSLSAESFLLLYQLLKLIKTFFCWNGSVPDMLLLDQKLVTFSFLFMNLLWPTIDLLGLNPFHILADVITLYTGSSNFQFKLY